MSIRDLIAGEKHETSNPQEDRQDRAPIGPRFSRG
jgi:hypothetical protein